MDSYLAHWQARLTLLAARHGVVGASLAIAHDGQTLEAATGVLNVRTGQPVKTDSLFQIGSITKVWTATLAMQLVDEGRLDLDAPVTTYLPEFRVADEEITVTVTARQLLTHTSGIEGDLFLDTGRGDDALPRFVAAMAQLGRAVPPGKVWCYCNSGYVLLGQLIASLCGMSWERAVHERLLKPLALGSAGTLPEEALLHGAAAGHFLPPGASHATVAPQWGMPRSLGPAGSIHATASQLIAFANLHLNDGIAKHGGRLLSASSAQVMRAPQVEIPDRWLLGSHCGLGWILNSWGDQPVYGHDGATLGQNAFLRVLPGKKLVMSLLVNGGRSPRGLFQELFSEIAMELAGVTPAPMPEVSENLRLDPARYLGRYAREGLEVEIVDKAGQLTIIQTPKAVLGITVPSSELALLPHSERVLLVFPPGQDVGTPVIFFDVEGRRYIQLAARTMARSECRPPPANRPLEKTELR